jgi:hypothetical protein
LLWDHTQGGAAVANASAVVEVLVQVVAQVDLLDNTDSPDLWDADTHEGAACMADREANEEAEAEAA